jgi:sulfite exporter TauE/SafE
MAGGVVLGLAASLHCAGMCAGLAALSFMPAGRSAIAAMRGAAALHVGRISAYAVLGATAGGLGTGAMGSLDPLIGHRLLRWAAALSLGWIGLSTAGLMPGPGALARFMPLSLQGGGRPGLPSLAAGFGWGLLPCGMVYGALLYALFSGSALGGALVMAGFGIGTLPGLAGAAFSMAGLRAMSRQPGFRTLAGMAIATAGVVSLIDPEPAFHGICAALRF